MGFANRGYLGSRYSSKRVSRHVCLGLRLISVEDDTRTKKRTECLGYFAAVKKTRKMAIEHVEFETAADSLSH